MAREDGLEPAVGEDGYQMKLFERMADGRWSMAAVFAQLRLPTLPSSRCMEDEYLDVLEFDNAKGSSCLRKTVMVKYM